jgi:DNA mismatch repair protein MutL
VENSLDAGATRIEVAIEDGGFTEIRVTDNGAGCDESQIEKVFLPHATSKIARKEDLEKILTLGFRGEALSSIASVSRVRFVSKTAGADVATKVCLDAGKITEKVKVGANNGTELIVRNLFYNVPARRKFLGTMRAEENNVSAVLQKLILANPCIAFKYTADGQVIYSANGGGLASAVQVIYGKDIAEKLIEVDVNRGGFTLCGFISRTDFFKKNRTMQTAMVNGRAVDSGIIGNAVNDAFSNYLMVGNFPFFVLDFRVDEGTVDVNVHPQKAQVKFEDERAVYDFVKAAVAESIDMSFAPVEEMVVSTCSLSGNGSSVKAADNVLTFLEKAGKFKAAGVQVQQPKFNPYYQHKKKAVVQQEEIKAVAYDFKILGTVLDTFILVESRECLYIIDQHAGHERLLFDELTRAIDTGGIVTQPMLEPVVLTLNPIEMNKVMQIEPILNQMGIECEVFGRNSFRISAVPLLVATSGIGAVITNVLGEVKGVDSPKLSLVIRDRIITECCRSAIKAGTHLTQAQIAEFLAQFKDLKVPLCPHGRPVVVALTRTQIEKMFKR